MAPTLEQSTDTHALGVDGNTPTSVAGDNYEGLTSKALKKLCSERDLAVRGDHAALVSRLRAGKKAGPKSSKERVSAHRTTRSQAKVVADKARNAGWMEQARANRTEEEVVADRAHNAPPRLLLACRPYQLFTRDLWG